MDTDCSFPAVAAVLSSRQEGHVRFGPGCDPMAAAPSEKASHFLLHPPTRSDLLVGRKRVHPTPPPAPLGGKAQGRPPRRIPINEVRTDVRRLGQAVRTRLTQSTRTPSSSLSRRPRNTWERRENGLLETLARLVDVILRAPSRRPLRINDPVRLSYATSPPPPVRAP